MNARLVFLAGPISFTGVQLISPTLPLLRTDLGLTATQLALVMSVYLLPAAFFALPAGFLADRWGRRRMLSWSLILFGLCGASFLLVGDSFVAFLAVRFVQGLAFASILPLTITILGDAFVGTKLVRAQGYRTVSLGIGEAILPVVGGYLAVFGWQAAWAVQILALPLGIVVWRLMEDQVLGERRSVLSSSKELVGLLRKRAILSVEWIGVQRMFIKFALLAFLPIYLVDVRGFSTGFVGILLGVSATAGVITAVLTNRITRRGSIRGWVGGTLLVTAATVVGYVLAPVGWLIILLGVVHGAADGISGVLSNSLVAVASPKDIRASFVAATGAARNLAKAVSPAILGALVLTLPLGTAFVLVGVGGMAGSMIVRALGPVGDRLRAREAG